MKNIELDIMVLNLLTTSLFTTELFATGLLIGAVLGLTGAGGSVLATPLLLVLLNLEPAAATGLALGVVAISSIYGSLHHILHRRVLWIPALLFGISGMVFAPMGRLLATHVSSHVLLSGFSCLALAIATRMLWQSLRKPEEAQVVRALTGDSPIDPLLCRFSESNRFEWKFRCTAGLTVGGMITGLLSGFFGVGGGFLIVPFLNQLNGVSMRNAVATSLVIISAISTSGFITHVAIQAVDWNMLLILSIGGIAGMILGSIFARRLAGVQLQRIFALTIIIMALVLLI